MIPNFTIPLQCLPQGSNLNSSRLQRDALPLAPERRGTPERNRTSNRRRVRALRYQIAPQVHRAVVQGGCSAATSSAYGDRTRSLNCERVARYPLLQRAVRTVDRNRTGVVPCLKGRLPLTIRATTACWAVSHLTCPGHEAHPKASRSSRNRTQQTVGFGDQRACPAHDLYTGINVPVCPLTVASRLRPASTCR